VRGLSLSRDDLVRRAVIMALMCQGHVSFESIDLSYLIDFRQYFSAELAQLQPMAEQGLVRIEPDGLSVSPAGWYVVRGIAMVFDRYLQAERSRERFSRII
jgi:oxygen-independent coproporphyrinogen-3 oxidase